MKYLLIISVLALFSCNAKSKTEETKNTADTNNVTVPVPDNGIKETNPPAQGKIDIESFGETKIDQKAEDLIKLLGEPDKKDKAMEWEADGLMHQNWVFMKVGLQFDMTWEATSPVKTIASINADIPNNWKTKAGMGIGNTYTEVQNAYKRDIDKESTTKEQIVVGSVYGGIIFTFKNDKVIHVFLGAAAE